MTAKILRIRQMIQKVGRQLSAMVMPNIGAFIAWGLLTALFIPTGWCPNETLARMVSPMLNYLLPLLIGYTAGKNISDERGGVVGAIATMGVIAGSDIPMFLGAMIMGPLGGWCIKVFDNWAGNKIRPGFEMLTNNFSVGILGLILAIFGFSLVGCIVTWLTSGISAFTQLIIDHGLLPLASTVVEPAKVMFLNNAINHGIFSPIGIEQVNNLGQSVLFLIESNPGAGLGMLLACAIAGRGNMKSSAPGAAIIHFLGGIHEIYFPYVLAHPSLILAMIAGSASGLFVFSLTGAGLVAPASPGSIISILAMCPSGSIIPVTVGITISAAVSFFISLLLLKKRKKTPDVDTATCDHSKTAVVFVCDAGMGSSALGASSFRRRALSEGLDLDISNHPADQIPEKADIIVCQKVIAERIKDQIGNKELVIIQSFISDPAIDKLILKLKGDENIGTSTIRLGLASESKEDAIRRAGDMLLSNGFVKADYISAMLEREKIASTYMGMGIAIPHGTSEAKKSVVKSGIVFLQYPEGVSFATNEQDTSDDEKAYIIIGIAGVGDDHLKILSNLSEALEDEAKLKSLMTATNPEDVRKTLSM